MKKLFIICMIPLLLAACEPTDEQAKEDPVVLTITQADVQQLNSDLQEATKAVQALPKYKEWKKLEAQFEKRATAELQKLPLWDEWKAEAAKKGLPGEKIFNKYVQMLKKYAE